MNDTFREYTSYGKVIIPLLKVKRTIIPDVVQWGEDGAQYFLFFPAQAGRDAAQAAENAAPAGADVEQDQEKRARKLVVYFHGGGWNSNSPKQHYFIGQKIAQKGYDCVMMGYRKVPKVRYEGIIEDVFTGYKKLKEYLAKSGRTYEKIIVSGSSAGAHLGALLCFDEEQKAAHGIAKEEFAGLLSMAGPLCFDHALTGSLKALIKGLFGTKDREAWKQGEPIRKLTKQDHFKVCLIQSKHDGLVGYEQADDFYKKALELGMDAKRYTVEDAWDTHSLYCVGCFLLEEKESATLKTVFEMLDEI